MASSKKTKSSKKPAAQTKTKTTKKKKAAPAKASPKVKSSKPAPKTKAGKPAAKAVAQKAKAKPAAKKPTPKAAPKAPAKTAPKAAKKLNTGDAWDNASMASKVAASTPVVRMSEPSQSPPHALHDHAGGLVSAVDDEEEVAERIHGGEEAVKDQDADDDSGSPRLDDREDEA